MRDVKITVDNGVDKPVTVKVVPNPNSMLVAAGPFANREEAITAVSIGQTIMSTLPPHFFDGTQ